MHTTEYYSALKRKKILTHATTETKLEDIMVSEISQSQKDKYCMTSLIGGKFVETEVDWWLSGVGGSGNEELHCPKGTESQFSKMKRVLRLSGADGCTAT